MSSLRGRDAETCASRGPLDATGEFNTGPRVEREQQVAVEVDGRQRLLAVLNVHLRQQLERLLERPVLVDVDLERNVRRCARGPDALEVEAVAAAELELQPTEATAGGRFCSARHVVGVA